MRRQGTKSVPLVLVAVVATLLPTRVALAAAPSISSIAPASGQRGATVTVSGTGFSGATAVRFNGAAASYTVSSDSVVEAVAPQNATSGPITVVTPGGTATSSSSYVMPPLPTALRIWVGPSRLTYGTALTIGVRLTAVADGSGVPNETVYVYFRRRGATAYGLLGTVRTDAAGAASVRHAPAQHTEYLLRHRETLLYAASDSPVAPISVAPRASIRLLTPAAIEQGAAIAVDGVVVPPHPGHPALLQRHEGGGRWVTVAHGTYDSSGRYALRHVPPIGTYTYRVHKPADADNLAASSPEIRVSVVARRLRSGMSGRDVIALQQRLAVLRYDVGAINGYFGYDTLHAVVAFQKVQGLPRTGVVDAATARRLATAGVPALRHRLTGLQVEVDLTRQVLLLGRDGAVIRVVDISSGNDQPYWDQGRRYIARTPRGWFQVERKINGVRVSRLGELYRPAYFYGGYAVHGSPSVPPYPASHGCIRITNPAMDRLYDLLKIGTPVVVYD